ncbi:SCO6880 family protein [Nocardioides hwasunensis]|uniref:SCO6880 family protein n=1 Tax=Nocardioides hwasunensis TaxID=397258 RepID=UPI002964C008|nr:SCO6880 family protein [Nocardioides hwasunensis]
MSVPVPRASESALTPIKFSRLARRGVLLGLSAMQLALVGTAAAALLVGLYLGAVVFAMPPIAACLMGAFVPVGGQALVEWVPIGAAWVWRSAGDQLVYRRRILTPRPAGTLALPGDAARLRQWVDAKTGAVMVHDPHAATLTSVVAVTHPAFVLLDPAEQERRVVTWGRVLATACRSGRLASLQLDGELEALRMLCDRREALTRRRVQTVDRLQALLAELLPGQAKLNITTGQAKAMLASVRPRDIAGKTRRRIAAEELAELVAVEAKIKKATAELKAIVLARGSHLMDLHGVGPVIAARVLTDVGDVTRFADRNRFASWTGTAPLDASSGEQNRHRLSRAGNRRMNHMIHIAAVSQLRLDTDGRDYYRRKRAEGKKSLEALRCLKRRISDAIYRQLVEDAQRAAVEDLGTGPGGHCSSKLARGTKHPKGSGREGSSGLHSGHEPKRVLDAGVHVRRRSGPRRLLVRVVGVPPGRRCEQGLRAVLATRTAG